ncbi:MAG: DUF3048 domain-containing protein [Firmicutes bacterium]|nr:DUF3048 domain-containing protein [Bacillota bacterium]
MRRKDSLIIVAITIGVLVTILLLYIALAGSLPGMRKPIPTTTIGRTETCPLTGEKVSTRANRVPFAVCIDNIAQARPQSGLDKADIIYEVSTEAGIPRFLAIYYCGGADRIGPVRSARTYFISLAKQFNAVLVHAGGSPQSLRQISEGEIRSLNEFKFREAYFRDRSRRAPHNLFTTTARLSAAAADAGFSGPVRVKGPSFDGDRAAGIEARAITIPFPTTTVSYNYDPVSGDYLRSMNGVAHTDAVTREQLRAKNVVVQFTKQRVIDTAGRLDIDLVGDGRAIFFIGGRRIEGRWIRPSESEPFLYKDSDGNTIKLNRGQTWVEIVAENMRVTANLP